MIDRRRFRAETAQSIPHTIGAGPARARTSGRASDRFGRFATRRARRSPNLPSLYLINKGAGGKRAGTDATFNLNQSISTTMMTSISDAVRATAQAVVAGGDLDAVVQLPAIWDIDKATLAKDIRGSMQSARTAPLYTTYHSRGPGPRPI